MKNRAKNRIMRKTTTNPYNLAIERLGESNPQLFRELKGKLEPRSVTVAIAISIIAQTFIYLFYQSLLPEGDAISNHYCKDSLYPYYSTWRGATCWQDSLGNSIVNWQLWWTDLFVCMSLIGICALVAGGTYLLIADLVKEESRKTLNFIRLSPQSAKTILTGKILGVPVLLYLVIALALPLHLQAGLFAGIPLVLILSFYGIAIVSCAFFYSAALLYSLVGSELIGFKPWLGSGAVLFFLISSTTHSIETGNIMWKNSLDWLNAFNPAIVLFYLLNWTGLNAGIYDTLEREDLKEFLWYFQPFWNHSASAIAFITINYALWTFWIWQGLERRFHNPNATVWSKKQSYWVCGCFVVIALGFALQSTDRGKLYENYQVLQSFLLVFFLGAIFALSPQRQTLQDWARYRHQNAAKNRSLIRDLIFGEKSPSIVAIALNMAIALAFIFPSILLLPLEEQKAPLLSSLILICSVILIYAAIAQTILLSKSSKSETWAWVIPSALIIFPPICLHLWELSPSEAPGWWLFSYFPAVAIEYASMPTIFLSLLGQWLVIALVSWRMTGTLQKFGASETKNLLSGKK